jgi:hypothetical protein
MGLNESDLLWQSAQVTHILGIKLIKMLMFAYLRSIQPIIRLIILKVEL